MRCQQAARRHRQQMAVKSPPPVPASWKRGRPPTTCSAHPAEPPALTHFTRHFQAAGIDGPCAEFRNSLCVGSLKQDGVRSTLAVLFADIASAQPSSAGLLALKSSFAGVAVVTCLVDPRPRSGPAMPMAECFVQPSG